MVLAGEISLELLQKAGEARVAAADRPFSNHYDLAAYLVDRASPILKGPLGDTALGRVDLLFELLRKLNMATPGDIADYILALSADTERRPIAEQIVDQILAEDKSRYQTYEEIRMSRQISIKQDQEEEPAAVSEIYETVGLFLAQWVLIEDIAASSQHTNGATLLDFPSLSFELRNAACYFFR